MFKDVDPVNTDYGVKRPTPQFKPSNKVYNRSDMRLVDYMYRQVLLYK